MTTVKHLVSWLGTTDAQVLLEESDHPKAKVAMAELEGCRKEYFGREESPLRTLLHSTPFDAVTIFSEMSADVHEVIRDVLRLSNIEFKTVKLKEPDDLAEVMLVFKSVLESIVGNNPNTNLNLFLTPGTPTMHSCWIVLSACESSSKLWEVFDDGTAKSITIPVEISGHIARTTAISERELAIQATESSAEAKQGMDSIVGNSAAMTQAKDKTASVALLPYPVLLLGETGTGKQCFAEAIHIASGRKGELVEINCATLRPETATAELFGYWKGAFTGADQDQVGSIARAHQGTLFLDEFGELPLETQAYLLRALAGPTGVNKDKLKPTSISINRMGNKKDGQKNSIELFDVRIICATNQNLLKLIESNEFRDDLYWRIADWEIEIPPLRNRGEDIIKLAEYFISITDNAISDYLQDTKHHLDKKAKRLLSQHGWPGNVRELRQTIRHAVAKARTNKTIGVEDIELKSFSMKDNSGLLDRKLGNDFSVAETMNELGRHYARRAYKEARKKSQREVARLLGIREDGGYLQTFLSGKSGINLPWDQIPLCN